MGIFSNDFESEVLRLLNSISSDCSYNRLASDSMGNIPGYTSSIAGISQPSIRECYEATLTNQVKLQEIQNALKTKKDDKPDVDLVGLVKHAYYNGYVDGRYDDVFDKHNNEFLKDEEVSHLIELHTTKGAW